MGLGSGDSSLQAYLLLVVYGVIHLVFRLRQLWLAAVLSSSNCVLLPEDRVLSFYAHNLEKGNKGKICLKTYF